MHEFNEKYIFEFLIYLRQINFVFFYVFKNLK